VTSNYTYVTYSIKRCCYGEVMTDAAIAPDENVPADYFITT